MDEIDELSTSLTFQARRVSEMEVADALQFVERIVDTVRESLLVLDNQLHVRFANRSFYDTFRATPQETQDRHIFELGNGQWNIPSLGGLLQELLASDTRFDNFELEHDFPWIGRRTMLLNAGIVQLQGDQPHLILLAMEDITARRRTELALEGYVRKLEWSNRELQDFAYVASHDLQEPLRAIQAFSERLQSKNGDALSDEGRDYLERMQNAAARMRSLIRDLLAFSSVTTKAKPFRQVDLNVEAHAAIADIAQQIEETGADIQVGELPTVEGDSTQMRQLLQNLMSNALKFHSKDKVPIVKVYACDATGQCDADTTTSPEATPQEMFRLVVEDNGIGFEQKYAERIFTPFQRLHIQTQYQGTGIGLAICRKIAERHNGSIAAVSAPGQGATFTVTVPQEQPPETA
jgi:signal transduction histidine kinase